jgi:hypothetical protein
MYPPIFTFTHKLNYSGYESVSPQDQITNLLTEMNECYPIYLHNFIQYLRRRWLSSGLLRHVVWQMFTDVSEVLAAPNIRAMSYYDGSSKHL